MSTPRNRIVRYTSEDFDTIRADVLAALRETTEYRSWTDHLPSNQGQVVVDIFAGLMAMARYHQNVTATESFPATARSRASLCRQAEWFGYYPHPAGAAQVDLTFTKTNPLISATIPKRTQIATSDSGIIFETVELLNMPAGQEEGTVGAVHARHVSSQLIGVSDGSKNQAFKLLTRGMVTLAEGENAVAVYVGGQEWTEYPSLAWAAFENGYRVWIDENGDAWIRFGDGTFGNVPANGAKIFASYLVGGGAAGNVGAHTLTRLADQLVNISSVTNEAQASGGSDIETNEELRANMPSMVITRGRAVTRSDYERLLEAFSEIDKVDVDHPSANIVRVYVLPKGGATPSATLLTAVREYLSPIRVITEDVQVLAPTLVPVDVSVSLELTEDADSGAVIGAIDSGIRGLLLSSEFNTFLRLHDLYDWLADQEDVEHGTVTRLARSGETGTQDIEAAAGEILTPGTITVQTA